ncbi:MAG: hypothetical protein A2Z15_02165 [Chloroflexi bacterium RBG_16_50_11]|nr:MAG: hypothetical protein A2Z15_02165 [Chloroflexi bacterium RBG_16_50_11]
MVKSTYPRCAHCSTGVCENRGGKAGGGSPSLEKAPAFCPMKLVPEVYAAAMKEYDKPEVKEFARLASVQEFQCYERLPDGLRTKLPRIEEVIQFARKCGYKRLGLAHCGGLAYEAGLVTDVLEGNGFEVISVQCKTGAVPKERIGLKPEEKIAGPEAWETMCNPIAQAMILNRSKVDMAIMLGLCIGHDTLFIKYCDVPLTVLAVKDRVLGHNPLAALYAGEIYYRRLKNKIE